MWRLFTALIFFQVCLRAESEFRKLKSIPNFIKVCNRNDPKLDECVMDSIEKIRPHLVKGIPELGIPKCEPLHIPEIVMNQGSGGPASMQSKYKDVKIYGPTKFVLKSLHLDLENNKVFIKLYLPSLYTIGDYTIRGKILMFPISGKGISKGNYSDIEATTVMIGEQVKKNGEIYFNVKDFIIDFSIGNATMQLTDLFDGDSELGEATNQFLNENWKSVAQEMKPVLERTIGDLFKKFSNKIYHKYPLNVLLPE